MNKFVIKIRPFPCMMGKEETVIVETNKDLDTTMKLMEKQLEENNPMFEYSLYGWESVDSFINELPNYDVDK